MRRRRRTTLPAPRHEAFAIGLGLAPMPHEDADRHHLADVGERALDRGRIGRTRLRTTAAMSRRRS